MSGIRWEKKNSLRSGDWWRGYVGQVVCFSLTPWDKEGREGWKLVCTLPEHRAVDMHPFETAEAAKGYSEEILKDFLKRADLQKKPTKSTTPSGR